MKKIAYVLVIALLTVNYLQAQTTETLTNSSIIKMVKAKLSDELIIDEINSSRVNFNMSNDSVKVLSNENVSSQIIQAMKTADEKQNKTTDSGQQSAVSSQQSAVSGQQSAVSGQLSAISGQQSAVSNKQSEVSSQQSVVSSQQSAVSGQQTTDTKPVDVTKQKESTVISHQQNKTDNREPNAETDTKLEIDKSTIRINTISYVTPLKQLITLYDNQFTSLAGLSQKWNQQIKDSLESEKRIKDIIAQDERFLIDKMNANCKSFSDEILNLKNKLTKDRAYYKRLKNDMSNYGKNLSEQLKKLSSETDRQVNDKFSELCKMVTKFHPNPSLADTVNMMTITKQKPDTNLVNHISPVNVILSCYENEINPIVDNMVLWNKKALELIHQDAKLAKQLEPLNKELQQYESQAKSVRKLNKQHISELKKQCKSLNDDRNRLAKQMGDDSEELSEILNQIKKEVSLAIKDRFNDAIENIVYSFEDKYK